MNLLNGILNYDLENNIINQDVKKLTTFKKNFQNIKVEYYTKKPAYYDMPHYSIDYIKIRANFNNISDFKNFVDGIYNLNIFSNIRIDIITNSFDGYQENKNIYYTNNNNPYTYYASVGRNNYTETLLFHLKHHLL